MNLLDENIGVPPFEPTNEPQFISNDDNEKETIYEEITVEEEMPLSIQSESYQKLEFQQPQEQQEQLIQNEILNQEEKSPYINKEDFNNFIKGLNILKNFTNVVNIENGFTYFVSDSRVFVIEFNCNAKGISLIVPDPEKQVNYLSFLTKSEYVSFKEENKIYKFWNDKNIKFSVRKGLFDSKTMITSKIFNDTYNNVASAKKLIEYNFKDNTKIDLDSFLSITKTVKNPHINLYTEKNEIGKDDLILSIGELNSSGMFELLRIPNLDLDWLYNATDPSSNRVIDTIIDKNIFNYDYSSLKMRLFVSDPNKVDEDGKEPDMNALCLLVDSVFTENDYNMRVIHKIPRNIKLPG